MKVREENSTEVINFLTEALKKKDALNNHWLHIPSDNEMDEMKKWRDKQCPACKAHCVKVEVSWSSGIGMGMDIACIDDCGWKEDITDYDTF